MGFVLMRLLMASFLFTVASCSTMPSKGVQLNPSNTRELTDNFKDGSARLECGTSCAGAWGATRRELRALYDAQIWNDLAVGVLNVGFNADLAYFYLGRAAEGLGYHPAAITYYRFSIAAQKGAGYRCKNFFDNCDGFSFPQDSSNRLAGINPAVQQGSSQQVQSSSVRRQSKDGNSNDSPVNKSSRSDKEFFNGAPNAAPRADAPSISPRSPTPLPPICSQSGMIEKYPSLCSDLEQRPVTRETTGPIADVVPESEASTDTKESMLPSTGYSPSVNRKQRELSSRVQRTDTSKQTAQTKQTALERSPTHKEKLPQSSSAVPIISSTSDTKLRKERQTLVELPANIGSWFIKKSTDQMTDKVSCTAFYKSDSEIQLVEKGFYISLSGRGGVRSVTLRFDEHPVRPLRLATDSEQRLGIVIFSPAEFSALEKATRLRIQVFTALRQIWQKDISLTGHSDALRILRGPSCK